MTEQLARALAAEFPEYAELTALLRLAAQTWPRYGLSAGDLSKLDPWIMEMLRTMLYG